MMNRLLTFNLHILNLHILNKRTINTRIINTRKNNLKRTFSRLLLLSFGIPALALAQTTPACTSRSAAHVTPLLELFTSEGCDSCPPADRWLSSLNPSENLNVMAWHVDYWDKLGWKDRFALPEAAQRQARLLRAVGSRNAYTPQTMVQGLSVYHQPVAAVNAKLAAVVPQPSPIKLNMSHIVVGKTQLKVDIQTQQLTNGNYQIFAALLENKLSSTVTAGENKGVTLKHDHVVRAWAGPLSKLASTNTYAHTLSIPKDAALGQLRVMVWAEDERGLPMQSLSSQCGF